MTGKIAAAVAVVAALCGGLYLGGHPAALPGPIRDAFVDESTSLQSEAFDLIEENFYRKVPEDKLRDASLRGMVRSLRSRFSHYFTARQNRLFREATSGEFSGVGLTVVERKRGLLVAGVFDGSPAKRAGIRPGDLITAVDGESIAGEASDIATARIKGRPGTFVALTVVRKSGKGRRVRVRRERIRIPVAEGRLVEVGGRKLGVVALSTFSSGAHAELGRQVQRLQQKGAEGFVLDLRANGGGLLDEAVLVSSLWVPDGTIVTTDGRTRPRRTFEATGETVTRAPVVVLVNRGTASASEIVTAVLSERLGAPVVGEKTFGKGVFGEVFELSNGGALDLVTGNYFTPRGRNLNGRGIRPDVKAVDDPQTARDEALDRALTALGGRVGRSGGG